MPTTTFFPTYDGVSIGDYNSIVGSSSHHPGSDEFYITAANPSSALRNAPTNTPTWGGTPTVGFSRTFPPTVQATRPPPCDAYFGLSLTTDAFGIDTSWELIDKNGGATIVSESSFASNQTHSFKECLYKDICYDFVINDEFDDGICCQQGNGSYVVSVDGEVIGSGGEFEYSETVFIGGCGVGWGPEPTPWPTSSPTVSIYPTVTSRPSYSPTVSTAPTHSFIPTPYFTPFPTEGFRCPVVSVFIFLT